MGGHRGRPATVDRVRPHEGRGRGHRQHRRVDHVPRSSAALHRRRRHPRARAADDEPAVPAPRAKPAEPTRRPYGPTERRPATDRAGPRAGDRTRPTAETRWCTSEHGGRRDAVRRRHGLRAVRRRRLRRRLLGPRRRRRRSVASAPRGDRPLDRAGVGGEPRLADLLLRRAVDRRSPRRSRRSRSRCSSRSPSPRSGSCCAVRASPSARRCSRTRDRRNFGAAFAASSVLVPVLHGRGRRCHRARVGCRPAVEAGDPWSSWVNPTSILGRGARGRDRRLPRGRVPRVGRPAPRRRAAWSSYFRRRAIGAAVVAGAVAIVGIFVLRADAPTLFDDLVSEPCPSCCCRPRAAWRRSS